MSPYCQELVGWLQNAQVFSLLCLALSIGLNYWLVREVRALRAKHED